MSRVSSSISVVLATYNGENYLSEQLESIAAQTLLPLELVVSDDLSSDRTQLIVDDFARAAPFTVRRIVRGHRGGYRVNFMEAAARCAGSIIAFCDQDDVWHPSKLANVMTLMSSDESILCVYHNSVLTNKELKPIALFYADHLPSLSESITLPPMFFPPGFSQCFRASLLKSISSWSKTIDWNDPNQPAAHDVLFFTVASSIGRIAYLETPLAYYRQHGKNLFGMTRNQSKLSKYVKDRFVNYSLLLEHYSNVCFSNSNMISSDWVNELPGCDRTVAERAERSWLLLHTLYKLRALIRGGKEYKVRLNAFRQVEALGAYDGTGAWNFGNRQRIRDLLYGVLLSPLVTRFGRPAQFDHHPLRGSGRL